MKKANSFFHIAVALTTLVLFAFSSLSATARILTKADKEAANSITSISSPGEISVSNDHLSLYVETDPFDGIGTFTLKTAAGYDLLYTSRDHDAWSSYLTVQVDGKNYVTGAISWYGNPIEMSEYLLQGPIVAFGNSIVTQWLLPEDILVEQSIELLGEAAKFTVITQNLGTQSRDVKLRFLFDYQVKEQDGAPIYAQGGIITHEQGYSGAPFTRWQTWDQMPLPTLTGLGSLITMPDSIVFANWDNAYSYSYDYDEYDPNRAFYTPGSIYSPESDSCALIYFDHGTLLPDNIWTVSTAYGVGPVEEETAEERLKAALQDLAETTIYTVNDNIWDVAEMNARTYKKVEKSAFMIIAKYIIGLGMGSFSSDISPKLHALLEGLKLASMGGRFLKLGRALEYAVDTIGGDWSEDDIKTQFYRGLLGTIPGQIYLPEVPQLSNPSNVRNGLAEVLEDLNDNFTDTIEGLPEELPEGYPVDGVIKQINDLRESIEMSRSQEVTAVWEAPEGYACKFGTLGSLTSYKNNYQSIYDAVGTADKVEDIAFWGCAGIIGAGAIVGVGGKIAGIAGIIPSGGTSILIILGAESVLAKASTVCPFITNGASIVEAGAFEYIEAYMVRATCQLIEETQLIENAALDTLEFINNSTHPSSSSSLDSIMAIAVDAAGLEIVDVNTPDIILAEGQLAGSQSGTITVKNNGSTAREVSGYINIYGPYDSHGARPLIALAAIEGNTTLQPEETDTVDFTYHVVRSSVLGCDQYYVEAYVAARLTSSVQQLHTSTVEQRTNAIFTAIRKPIP